VSHTLYNVSRHFVRVQDRKVLSLAYVALGKLTHKFPQLVSTNMALVQVFFNVMSQVLYWTEQKFIDSGG